MSLSKCIILWPSTCPILERQHQRNVYSAGGSSVFSKQGWRWPSWHCRSNLPYSGKLWPLESVFPSSGQWFVLWPQFSDDLREAAEIFSYAGGCDFHVWNARLGSSAAPASFGNFSFSWLSVTLFSLPVSLLLLVGPRVWKAGRESSRHSRPPLRKARCRGGTQLTWDCGWSQSWTDRTVVSRFGQF